MPGAEIFRDGVAGWLAPVRALARPVSEGLFAGVLDYAKLPLVDSLKMRALSAATRTPEGDYRDWDAIRAWARDLARMLPAVPA
jgi:menaquinone-dependent protoporphyrinogen oxidase